MKPSSRGGDSLLGETSRETRPGGAVDVAPRSRANGSLPAESSPKRTPPTPPEQPPPRPSPGSGGAAQNTKWIVPLAVVVIGMFMSTLDTSIVNVAIPTMQQLLD